MAKVKQVSLCPNCGAEVDKVGAKNCSQCHVLLTPESNPLFDGPAYIDLQLAEYASKTREAKKDGPELDAELKKLETLHQRWFRECSDDDRISSLRDSLHYLENLLNSNASVEAMRTITAIGKRIGELSKNIENYASIGGRFYGNRISNTAASFVDPEDIEQA